MIYIIINLALTAYLMWASTNVNTKTLRNADSLINIVLMVAGSSLLTLTSMAMILWGPEKFTVFLEHFLLFGTAAIFIVLAFFFIVFATGKRNGLMNFLEIVLMILALYVAFAKVNVEDYTRLSYSADLVFNGTLAEFFPVTWEQVFYIGFIFAVPAIAALIMLLVSENSGSRHKIQTASSFSGALIFGWIGIVIITITSEMLPMTRAFYPVILSIMATILIITAANEKIYDVPTIISTIIVMIIKFAVPAFIVAIIYVAMRPFYFTSRPLYVMVVIVSTVVVIELANLFIKAVSKISTFRSSRSDDRIEHELAALNYENEPDVICKELARILKDNISVETIKVFVESGNGELNVAYSTDSYKPVVMQNDPALEAIMSLNLNMFVRDDIHTNIELIDKRDDLRKLFNLTRSEVVILLREGHHILGLLTLGKKRLDASYDEDDRILLNKMYSYFFVFGYYMKNIANASVVGTVNRELRMSAQIITSIQENIDPVKNPKMDVGYLMVPAHNIGGEFIDMIRLTDTRHILVVGSLSGKGISASMSMVILKSVIRTYLEDTHDFKKLIAKVNSFIRFNLPKGTFFAGIFCLVDFETDTFYYVNCGIPTMLLYTRSFNNVIEVQGNGYVLGFVKNITPLIKVKQLKLTSGDVISITTNGLINSHSLRGDQFGKDRIKKSMTDNYMYSSDRMARFLFDDLQHFMARELDEDVTVMMIRYLGKDTQTVHE